MNILICELMNLSLLDAQIRKYMKLQKYDHVSIHESPNR